MIARNNATAMKLAWEFFKGNYALNFAAIAILIVLNLLGIVPVIGMLFIFAYSILSLSIQIYFARSVEQVQSVEEIGQVASETKIGELLSRYLQVAAGAFLGLFLIALVFMFIFGIMVSVSGGADAMMQAMGERGAAMEMHMAYSMISFSVSGLILLLIIGVLFYFFPAVMGKVMREDDFVGAFKNVFLLFSPTLWKSTFNKEYFTLVLVWSLVMVGVVIVAFVLAASIILLPLLLVFAYIVSLYNAAIYIFAADLARK